MDSTSALAVNAATGASDLEPRAKLYELSEDGTWDDLGVGRVTVKKIVLWPHTGLYFIDDKYNKELLLHRIEPENVYRKNQDTITWYDPVYDTDRSFSFEETAGCSNIWSRICKVQMSSQRTETLNNKACDKAGINLDVLREVELSTLPSILKTLTEYKVFELSNLIGIIKEEQGFIMKLMELFRTCEDREDIDSLYMIFRIVKAIILLNTHEIFELLLDDTWVVDIFGCLEYNPKVTNVQRHRDFSKNHMVIEEAMPIKDPLTLSKMQQTHRLANLKEAILCTELDSETIQTIDEIIHENNAEVILLLMDDNTILQEIFARLRSSTTSVQSKKNLVCFLHELCKLIKSASEFPLYRVLMNEGIFDIVAEVLQSPDRTLVSKGIDIITRCLHHDTNHLIKKYIQEPKGRPLLGLLVKGFTTDLKDGIHCQFLQILYTLLDVVPSLEPQGIHLIEIFCEKHLCELIDIITFSCPLDGAAQLVELQNNVKPEILLNICELICFCIQHKPFIIKYFFLCNNTIYRVLSLTRRRENYLVAASVRFMRTILSHHDSILTAHITKNNLLKPIVVAFITNGNRYNLLQSAVLELFEFIYMENMSSLVTYLVDTFWDELVKFEYLSSIRMLKAKYDKYLDDDAAAELDSINSDMEEVSFCDKEDTISSSISNKKQCQTGLSHRGTTSYQSSSGCAAGYLPPPLMQPKLSDGEEEIIEELTRKHYEDSMPDDSE